MPDGKFITQVCVVVPNAREASSHWAKVLGIPMVEPVQIFAPDTTLVHYTNGQAAYYSDLFVALYDLGNLVIELMQPGPTPSPWRDFLDRNGPGVFHFCVQTTNRKQFQDRLREIGIGLPYHIGYFRQGSYSYVDSREQLGLELSINNQTDMTPILAALAKGSANPLDELN